MKRVLSLLLALLMLAGALVNAVAVDVGEQRVVLGADLNADQRAQMFSDFGLLPGVVPEMTVTIEEERAHLRGLVPDSVIGSRSISSIYIMTTAPGTGLDVTVNNINWLTEAIYINALVTAGITNARVIISAPVPVSGTAALTGIYKAFEDITGEELEEDAKLAGIEEAIVTGEIAAALGDDEQIAQLMNELKLMLAEIRNMTDDQVRDEIRNLAREHNINLTSDQVEQILRLARTLQNLDLGALQGTLVAIAENWERLAGIGQGVGGFLGSVAEFFSGIGGFFARLFGN